LSASSHEWTALDCRFLGVETDFDSLSLSMLCLEYYFTVKVKPGHSQLQTPLREEREEAATFHFHSHCHGTF